MGALLLLVLAVLAATGWYWSRYPGKWVYAFTSAYAQERAALRGCRRELGEVTRKARQAEKAAKEQADLAEADYRRGVRVLEQEIKELLEPGWGRLVKGPVGDITLYEHVVKVTGRSLAVIPLAGLKAVFRSDPTYMIDLTEPGGRTHRAKYPRRRDPDDQGAFFTSEQLSDFTLDILNAAADEHEFLAQRQTRLPQARQELKAARSDTEARDEALENLRAVCAWQKADPRRKELLAELDAERSRWQQLTGKMPPR
ncbi:hypothetical protein MHW47_22165 [Streptomyces sp. OfavH-34-F]|uniref:hypothetical protein n=1 Tax=Streptomyces sp. OfavH-34-F TaxID=2917760 RepID=UPI001EF292F2|nr:hypothetical protein [Streptomyces sp. OfavH-34-F]MCG7527138.1 hypothetical protein [Streptomyces sp. OfavH-34-F]